MRVFSGTLHADVQLVNGRTGTKERIGQVLEVQGKEHHPVNELGPGDIGAVPKLKDVVAGDVLAERADDRAGRAAAGADRLRRGRAQGARRGREDGDGAAPALGGGSDAPHQPRRAHERAARRAASRRCTSRSPSSASSAASASRSSRTRRACRTSRRSASKTRAHARYKKQTGGRGQFGDCHIEVEPLPAHEGYEFVDKIVGGVIPQGFRPAVDKGIQDTMHAGDLAGYPVIGVRVTLVDGSYHSVDSSEMAFRIAGSMAFKKAYSEADPVLLEPIMAVEITSPSETVGDVIGDLNSRRGRPLGMDPVGQSTVIRAEVPMSEMLSYAPDLTSLTGGRGDYAMTLARYEEVPAHVSQRLIADLQREREAAKA